MNFKNIFRFSIDSLLWRKRSTLAVWIMAAVTLAILDLVATNYFLSVYRIMHLREMIEEPMAEACYVEELYLAPDDLEFSQNLSLFMRDMKNISGVKYSGRYYQMEVPEEVIQNSNSNVPGMKDVESFLLLYADQELLPLCGVSYVLYDAVSVQEDALPILLGADRKDWLAPGQVFMIDSSAFQVVGYMQKNSRWLPDDIQVKAMEEVDLDSAGVVFIDPEQIASEGDLNGLIYMKNIFLTLDSASAYQTVASALQKLASQYHIAVELRSMEQVFAKMREDNRQEILQYLVFLIFISVVSLLAIVSGALVSILVYKKMYGTMYACGFSAKDFTKMFLLKNTVLIVAAACAAWIYRIYSIRTETYGGVEILLRVHSRYVSLFLAGVCIIAVLVTSIVPVVYLRRFTAAQMIQSGKE